MKLAKSLMFQGTGSDVGKSFLVAGLCRLLANRNMKILPFKPQNMSNNAAVTSEGGEIGRAQWLQTLACRAEPSVHMNPILLKPQSDTGAQLVVQGRPVATWQAGAYMAERQSLMPAVLESFAALQAKADLILVEGAGSPAEINLRTGDIANMGFACATKTPVILIGDIDRGGVIASLVGTKSILPPEDQAMIKAFLINKFRGDITLFDDGLAEIIRHTGWNNLGVVPHLAEAVHLPAEDAVSISPALKAGETLHIAVPMLSRISNFDDFDPLIAEPDVSFQMVPPGKAIPRDTDLIILPGTKSTIGDLAFLRTQGWDIDILSHARHGGHILGICGGFQLLGTSVYDPNGIEGSAGSAEGLGLLDVVTEIRKAKNVRNTNGLHAGSRALVEGYEIHAGRTWGQDCARPMFELDPGPDGAQNLTGTIQGTYLHGLFTSDTFRHQFLASLRARTPSEINFRAGVDKALDDIARKLEEHVDIKGLLKIAGI